MTIVRWDPFREFDGAWMPPVDIFTTGEHELVIKAEIPGMSKENIDITVENFTLTIRGEKKTEQAVKDDQFHRVERSYGAFTRSFAALAAPDRVRVNCIAPGPIDTPRFRAMNGGDAGVERVRKNMPLGTIPQPVEIARVAIFLLSEAASQITGQVIHVNGGLLMP